MAEVLTDLVREETLTSAGGARIFVSRPVADGAPVTRIARIPRTK